MRSYIFMENIHREYSHIRWYFGEFRALKLEIIRNQ